MSFTYKHNKPPHYIRQTSPEIRPDGFKVMCAWCKQVIGGHPDTHKSDVSHGICKPCVKKYFPQFAH